jgi:hypothetical protein
MVAFNVRSNISEIEVLQSAVPNIGFRDPEYIEDYLVTYPQIKYFLVTVWPKLAEYFGRSISVELEMLTYPDSSGSDELVGWIQYEGGDIDQGLDKLEEFEAEIFDKQVDLVGDAFNFNIDFV